MSGSLLNNIAVAAVIFLLPLAGAPERLLHPAPWIGFVAWAVTLVCQPPLGPRRMVADAADRCTGLAIFLCVIGCQLTAIIQFGYRAGTSPDSWSGFVAAGFAITFAGLVLRLWAIRTLGEFFTSTVMVGAGQHVVDHGPYRLVRHPSYTGTILTCLGVSVALASEAGALLVVALVVPAYMYRIHIEERTLVAGLGEAYRAYRAHTWRLIPFVF